MNPHFSKFIHRKIMKHYFEFSDSELGVHYFANLQLTFCEAKHTKPKNLPANLLPEKTKKHRHN